MPDCIDVIRKVGAILLHFLVRLREVFSPYLLFAFPFSARLATFGALYFSGAPQTPCFQGQQVRLKFAI